MAIVKEKPFKVLTHKQVNIVKSSYYHEIGLKYEHNFHFRLLILQRLHNYGDNGPIVVGGLGEIPFSVLGEILSILAKARIVDYREADNGTAYHIFVTNRFKLEHLRAELNHRKYGKSRKEPLQLDNIVYYDTRTGEMFCNGRSKRLSGRNKKLFDALMVASPNYAARSKLTAIARSGKYADVPTMYLLSEAFTNLRKVCGVNANVIQLDSLGGKLNAFCYPLSDQLPPQDL